MSQAARRTVLLAGGVALVVLAASHALAQRFHVHTYNEGDGLASSTVRGMVQDSDGRMWFATRAGITVYDGEDWAVYSTADGLPLEDWRLLDLDGSGRVWAASDDLRVARYDGRRWWPIPHAGMHARCRLRGLAATERSGAERVALGTSCGVSVWDGSAWYRPDVERGPPATAVTALEKAGDRVYVGRPAGLAVLDRDLRGLSPPPVELPPGLVTGLAADAAGDGLWVLGRDWIGRIEAGRFELLADGLEIAGAEAPRSAVAGAEQDLFFGNHLALYRYQPGSGMHLLDRSNGLISGGVHETYRDRENNVWVSSSRGVSKIVSFRFATLGKDHGLFDDEVTAVLELRDGGFVLGHRGGLTFVDDETGGSVRTIGFPESNRFDPSLGRVLDMAEDENGTLWIAGNRLGLGRLEGERVLWSRTPATPVSSVLVSRERRLWLASGRDVLVATDGGFDRATLPDGIDGGTRRLFEAPDGAVWALTAGAGAHRLLDGAWESWAHPNRRDLNDVFSAYADGERMWVGTAGGLAEVTGEGTLVATRPPDPVIERPVYFMLRDDHDRVWFGTDNGVLRSDGATLERFTVEDGLGGRETNRAAGILDARGRVWIGTTRGVTVYREELDRRVPVPPIVTLHRLEASGRPEGLTGPVRLNSDRNDLVFSFRAISFYNEHAVRTRAWLEGFESGWSEDLATHGRLRYTNLSPGRYRLHLQAGSAAGPWSDPIRSPRIEIAPPFYGTAWFWTVAAAAAGLVLYAAQRYVYHRRYARRLEAEVEQRVADLRRAEAELARAQRLESLGLLAGGIAHDFNNLLMIILGSLSLIAEKIDGRARRWIADAESAIERARELTAQLLTFSRGGAPVRDAARIEDVVRESATFVLRGSNVRCEIDLPPDLRTVEIDTGQINQVLNNILLNAVQAMPSGGSVHISGRNVADVPGVAGSGPSVEISIRDEGTGIPAHDLPRIFDPYFTTKETGSGLGLTTAYSIARRHGGTLTATSTPGRGTTFRLYLPEAETSRDQPPRPQRGHDDLRDLHVLVMDDDDAVREVVTSMLESLGCTVRGASDGEEALRAWTSARETGRPYDAVIADLTVPGGMGGEEMARRLRDLDPRARVIVSSGYAHAPVLSQCRERGFRAALRKPFRKEELAEALRRAIEVGVGS